MARVAAGLQLKNHLTSKDAAVRFQHQQQWSSFDAAVRQEIKTMVSIPDINTFIGLKSGLLQRAEGETCLYLLVCVVQVLATLGTEERHHHSAAQCIAYMAAVELQMNAWPELIPTLLSNVTSPQSTEQLKEASLEAIGYICEDLVSE